MNVNTVLELPDKSLCILPGENCASPSQASINGLSSLKRRRPRKFNDADAKPPAFACSNDRRLPSASSARACSLVVSIIWPSLMRHTTHRLSQSSQRQNNSRPSSRKKNSMLFSRQYREAVECLNFHS